MDTRDLRRRVLLALLVAISGGCAVTQWQREQDGERAMFEAVEALNGPAMDAAIRAARPLPTPKPEAHI